MLTYPNLYHLQYFVDAVETGSVSAAASKNLVSHAAVSQAIRSLEEKLGFELMSHKKKSFEVTDRGRDLARKAKEILSSMSLLTEATPARASLSGSIAIGMSRSLAGAYLSAILAEISKVHPDLKVSVRLGTTGEMVERTARGTLDLALTIGHEPLPTLKQTLLHRGRFVIIRPVSSRARDPIEQGPFILTEPRYETELLKKSYYERFGKAIAVKAEVGSWDVIVQLVSDGLGCGLVPEAALVSGKGARVKVVPAKWLDCPYEVFLSENKAPSRAPQKAFVSKVMRLALHSGSSR